MQDIHIHRTSTRRVIEQNIVQFIKRCLIRLELQFIAPIVKKIDLPIVLIVVSILYPGFSIAQTSANQIFSAFNQQRNNGKAFRLEQIYYQKDAGANDTFIQRTTQYLRYSSKQQEFGYRNFDYLIKLDTICFYKQQGRIFSHHEKSETYAINSFYEDLNGMNNPYVYGIFPANGAIITLDSTTEYYLLTVSEFSDSASTVAIAGPGIIHEYKIQKNNLHLISYSKRIDKGVKQRYFRLEFLCTELSEKKFRKVLDDYFYKSNYVDIPTLNAQLPKKELRSDTVPHFEVLTLEGRTVSSDSLQRLTLIDFWFAACKPCLESMPHLQALHSKYSTLGLVVLGVNTIDDTTKIEKILQKYQIDYAVTTEGFDLVKKLKVEAFPTLILMDKNRKILFYESGFDEYKMKELTAMIAKLLQ